jgi:DNA-binding transcriptional LysR family regulator
LRISAPLLFSQTAMGKLAAEFALKYPEVRLEVTTEDRPSTWWRKAMTW